jgi:hypothetical protein
VNEDLRTVNWFAGDTRAGPLVIMPVKTGIQTIVLPVGTVPLFEGFPSSKNI